MNTLEYTASVSSLTLFGVLAVSAMLVFYALERRGPVFILWFAGACAASSAYGFLQGAWPFGIVEAIWTVVAIQRWRTLVAVHVRAGSQPIACNISVCSTAERRRYDGLRARVSSAIKEVVETDAGFALQLDATVAPPDIAEWMALERRCCPFMDINLALKQDLTTWVVLSGDQNTKDLLRHECASLIAR